MFDMIITAISQLRTDKKGVTAIEYALIATFIAVAIITGATTLGSNINTQFVNIGKAL